MTPVIRARRLVRQFGHSLVLDGIDLEVPEGESLALIGPNGSGRTTLLEILAVLRPPSSGTLEIAGIDARRFPYEARPHVMYVSAGVPGGSGLRVREYLDFVRQARRRRPGTGVADVRRAFEPGGLPDDADVNTLSTGLRKQLVLTAGILTAPRILLLDDPLASLDADARQRFLTWFIDLRRGGTTIVAAVNDGADGHLLCGAVVRMERGRLIAPPRMTDDGRGARTPAIDVAGHR